MSLRDHGQLAGLQFPQPLVLEVEIYEVRSLMTGGQQVCTALVKVGRLSRPPHPDDAHRLALQGRQGRRPPGEFRHGDLHRFENLVLNDLPHLVVHGDQITSNLDL